MLPGYFCETHGYAGGDACPECEQLVRSGTEWWCPSHGGRRELACGGCKADRAELNDDVKAAQAHGEAVESALRSAGHDVEGLAKLPGWYERGQFGFGPAIGTMAQGERLGRLSAAIAKAEASIALSESDAAHFTAGNAIWFCKHQVSTSRCEDCAVENARTGLNMTVTAVDEERGVIAVTTEAHSEWEAGRALAAAEARIRAAVAAIRFREGDAVQLNSGGPVMKVVSTDELGLVCCQWATDAGAERGLFAAEMLKLQPGSTTLDERMDRLKAAFAPAAGRYGQLHAEVPRTSRGSFTLALDEQKRPCTCPFDLLARPDWVCDCNQGAL